jgi:hypothetical protein
MKVLAKIWKSTGEANRVSAECKAPMLRVHQPYRCYLYCAETPGNEEATAHLVWQTGSGGLFEAHVI